MTPCRDGCAGKAVVETILAAGASIRHLPPLQIELAAREAVHLINQSRLVPLSDGQRASLANCLDITHDRRAALAAEMAPGFHEGILNGLTRRAELAGEDGQIGARPQPRAPARPGRRKS
ncbi:MAG: hypothetical protein V3R98_13975 [Alphaproteobacteria bacterium]